MRLGITMRVVENTTYPECRNALSVDWIRYLYSIWPDLILVPLLNDSGISLRVIKHCALDGVIFSGGEDWGVSVERDKTEESIFNYCLENNMPILGICRGFQIINYLFNGSIEKNIELVSSEGHVKTTHKVNISGKAFIIDNNGSNELEVNSYHKQGLMSSNLAGGLLPFAISNGGVIEGYVHGNKPILCVQWHPERGGPDPSFSKKIITNFFEKT